MASIVIGGDCATTTSLAIAAAWPEPGVLDIDRTVMVVEADPKGGSLAAWLDTALSPSLSSVVAALHQRSPDGADRTHRWAAVDSMIRRSKAGVSFVPAPFRAREARGAIAEAERTLFPLLASDDRIAALVEVGRVDPLRLPGPTRAAELFVLVHRQDASSAPASTVRLERLAETVASIRAGGQRVGLAVIGADPFSLDEIVEFTDPNGPAWDLADDRLSAAVLAGRTGVSARRLARLPLMRSARPMSADLASLIQSPHDDLARVQPSDGHADRKLRGVM